MFSAIVLEKSDKDLIELEKALKMIDPGVKIYSFNDLKSLRDWFYQLIECLNHKEAAEKKEKEDLAGPDGPDKEAPEHEASLIEIAENIAVIISDHRIMGPGHYPLISKIQAYLTEKKLSFDEKKPSFLFSVNELEEIDFDAFVSPGVENVIFKPYDLPIVKERVKWAVLGLNASGGEELYSEKSQTKVEMIRDVRVERITEIGFRTVSVRPIAVGRVAKYYGDLFRGSQDDSVFAMCTKSIAHPVHDDQYRCSFSFFGASNSTIKSVRAFIKDHGQMKQVEFPSSSVDELYSFVIINEDQGELDIISGALNRTFRNLEVYTYTNVSSFLFDLDPKMGLENGGIDEFWPHTPKVKLQFDTTGTTLKKHNLTSKDKSFLGLSVGQISQLRGYILKHLKGQGLAKFTKILQGDLEENSTFCIRERGSSYFFTVVSLVKDEEFLTLELEKASEESALKELSQPSPFKGEICGVMVGDKMSRFKDRDFWHTVKSKIVSDKLTNKLVPHLFLISTRQVDQHDEVVMGGHFSDHFRRPLDIYYFLRKVNYAILELQPVGAALFREYVDVEKNIQAVLPVKVERATEVSLSLSYYRALPEGRFRHFKMWLEGEGEVPTLLAKCVSTEKNPQSTGAEDAFLLHFVFFALHADQLELIRKWTIMQYSISKQKAGS